ncbi:MAG TPA: NAD(P)-dependent alcohol dehydrogenase [Acidimicrobiaceae bacterium]|nr:NAD(P)-dependent alcohol dehydrogenase [Acidimicrobiaceae bacterium]
MSEALPDRMHVAVYRRPGEVVVEERPVPRPGPGQVLVEVDHCGVCGSDIHMLVDGWGTPGMVAGHEFAGTVRALGPDVAGWSADDVVVGGPSPRCGHCRRCLEGKPSQCERRGTIVDGHVDGAFARFVLSDARALRRVPTGLAPRAAALAEPLAVALHGITRAGLGGGETVMIFGAGPIGALALAALVAEGRTATVVEPSEARRELAVRLGARAALQPGDLQRFERHQPERLAEPAVDVVLECSGKKAAMELGLHQLARGGRLVLVGAGMDEPAFDPNRVLLNELEIRGSFVYDADGFERALDLLASGAVPVDVLVEQADVTLDGIPAALDGLASARIAGKVMVVPRLRGEAVTI